jgi:hypothetical protein
MVDQLSRSAAYVAAASADEDVLVNGRQRRVHWRLSRTSRALLMSAAVLALAALVFGFLAVHTAPRHRVLSVPAAKVPGATTTDAVGCPIDRLCTVRGTAGGNLTLAFLTAFPSGQVVLGEQTVDAASGRVYRASLTASVDGQTSLMLSTQCVPGGVTSPQEEIRRSEDGHWDLANNWQVYARGFSVLVPGHDGCSVQLEVQRIGDRVIYERPALDLARNPSVQL